MNTTPGPLEVLGNLVSFFLFKLIDCVNRHFASRPRFERSWRLSRLSLLRNWESSNLNSEDPIWGIKRCILRFVELLSADEYERRLNMDIFKVHLGREDPGEQFVTMFSPHSGRLCMTTLEDAFDRDYTHGHFG